jgi:ectoine hydroxylase-related dioxygenase (phytanoyl-CoA dioxygenase family)
MFPSPSKYLLFSTTKDIVITYTEINTISLKGNPMTNSISFNLTPTSRTLKRRHSEISNDSLHTVGYKIYRAVVKIPQPILQEAVNRSQKAEAIFNHNEGSARNDHKRRQCTLSAKKSSKMMKEFLRPINQFLSDNVSTHLKISPWVVLHSKPGCQNQAAHCDYVPDNALKEASDEQMPLAALVALMDGTKLNVWPKSIHLACLNAKNVKKISPISCQVVDLKAGDILVFRGDFIHAGSCYQEDNYRLHTFLDSDAVERKRNKTWIIHQHADEALKAVILPK